MYGGRIFPDRPETAESGRHCGVSLRQDSPNVSGRQQVSFAAGVLLQAMDHLVQRRRGGSRVSPHLVVQADQDFLQKTISAPEFF